MQVTSPESIRTNELFAESISSSPFRNNRISDAMLENEEIEDETLQSETEDQPEPTTPNLIGNSLSSLLTSSTWSSNTANNELSETNNKSLERSDSCTTSISRVSNQKYSYNAILKKHETERVIDWTDVWKKFEVSLSTKQNNEDPNDEPEFEVVSNPEIEMFSLENVQNMVELTCKLGLEKGLDRQGFLCDDCAHPIGIDFSEAK